jgi:hypothetical protein
VEQVKPADLNAIATRAAIAQQHQAAELKPQGNGRAADGAKGPVAQAFLPAHLIWCGGDDERSISGLACALANATVPGIQPASHRASPRIAADPCGPIPAKNILPDVHWNYSVEDLGSFDYPQPLRLPQVHLRFLSDKSQNIPFYFGISPLYLVWIPLYPVKSRLIPDVHNALY